MNFIILKKTRRKKNNIFLQNEAIVERMKMELENQFKRDAKKVNYDKIK